VVFLGLQPELDGGLLHRPVGGDHARLVPGFSGGGDSARREP
jgi:hypothetical protein